MRVSYLAIGVALLLAVTAGSASAASTASFGTTSIAVSSDTSVVVPETSGIKATVRIVTGKKGFRGDIGFHASTFQRYLLRRPLHEGSPLRFVGLDSIDGPFRVLGGGGGGSGGMGCDENTYFPLRGIEPEFASYTAEIPANSTVELVARYEIVADPPWVNTNYAPNVQLAHLRRDMRGRSRETNKRKWDYVSKNTVLSPPKPTIAIPLAARVDLDFSPRLKRDWWSIGPLPTGKSLTVIGTLVPTRVGYPINLWIDGKRLNKTFLTDAKGQIEYRFKPIGGGYSTRVRAAFPGMPGADLLPDTGCQVEIDTAAAKKGSK